MDDSGFVVVKVGGSLFDLPDLGGRLKALLASLDANRVAILPGGGMTTDAVRLFDRIHHLGDERSHWLAIQALSVNARFLQALLPETPFIHTMDQLALASASGSDLLIVDALPFFWADECRADHLPHSWDVTSDSLAVRAATLLRARKLVLLKSVTWHGEDWGQAAQAGVVDAYLVQALRQSPSLRVRLVNLRTL